MNQKKKRLFIIIISLLIVLVISLSFYYFNKVKPFNDSIGKANISMNNENYSKAIVLYEIANSYKKTTQAQDNIKLANILIASKDTYTEGLKLMNSKDYLSAADYFEKVDKQDSKRYVEAQNKINECKNSYIIDNLHLANEYLKQNKFDDANTVLSSMLEVDVENTDALNLKAQITKAIQKQKEDKIAAEAKAEAMKKDAMRLNSQGHFIDERHYNLYLNGQEDEYNLSGLYITLENLNGNKADIDFAFYSQGGSVPCHGSGPATYVGNGEWRFAFVNSTFFRYGIAIFKVKGDTAYLAIKEESYKFNGEYSDGLDPNNIKTFQEKDYNEINAGHFNTAYRTEHSYL